MLEQLYSTRVLDWQLDASMHTVLSIISSRHAVAARCNLGLPFKK